jgi:hypothetical protein
MSLVRSLKNLPWMIEVDALAGTGTNLFYKDGMVVKEGSAASRVTLIAAKGDTAIGVISGDQIDPKTDVHEAAVAGDKRNYYPLGCKEIVHVYAEAASLTFAPGVAIYLSDSVDGAVTPTAATSRPIGHYPRNMASQVTAAIGEKVPCWLDVEPGASTV